MQALVLASGSQYRAELLTRLGIPFQTISPDIDESVRVEELPASLAQRLAQEKAIAAQHRWLQPRDTASSASGGTTALIIASDQVASVDKTRLSKPMDVDTAHRQLASMSGRTVSFHTALHLLDVTSQQCYQALDITHATLRELDSQTIARYVERDQPLDCAGSFKVESLGISLFESVRSEDPTALIGLPMIELCRGLRQFGLQVP